VQGGPGNDVTNINQNIYNYFLGGSRYGGGHFGGYVPQFNFGQFGNFFQNLFGFFGGNHCYPQQSYNYCYPTTYHHYPTTAYSNATASAYAGGFGANASAMASAYAGTGGWGYPGASAYAAASARAGAGTYWG